MFSAFPPSFSKNPMPGTMMAAVGGNATLVCQPEAAPFPQFSWAKNGADIGATTTPTERVRLLDNGNLFISPVELADAGTYTCTATNDLGSDSSEGYLGISGESDMPPCVFFHFMACTSQESKQIRISVWSLFAIYQEMWSKTELRIDD